MITFFRRLRRSFLSQSKFSKYVVYALGEIILVVIGILIALQINNANENSKERAEETSYLKRLIIDLEENKILWKETLIRKKKQLEAAHAFINFRFSKDQDSVNKILPHFYALGSWQDININQVTFNEMVSSGNLNIIANDSIKIKLLSLDKLYKSIINNQDLIENEHRVRLHEPTMKILNTSNAFVLDNEQSKVLEREFSNEEKNVYFSQFKKELMTLINDKIFMNGVVGITYNAKSQFISFKKAEKDVNALIVLIENELIRQTND